MKRSRIFTTAAFVLAVSAAFAFKTTPKQNVFTTRWKIDTNNQCVSIVNTDCDGPNTRPLCTNVFDHQLSATECEGATYRNP